MTKFSVFILLLIGGTINAQTISTDRSSKSISSTIVPKSSLQLEAGSSVTYTPFQGRNRNRIILPNILVRYGVSKYFELRASTQFESSKAPTDMMRLSGIGDLQFGLKISLLDNNEDKTKVAIIGHLVSPSGSRGITANEYYSLHNVAVSHELNKNVNLFYNLGYNVFLSRIGDLTYSLGLGVAVTDKVAFFIEHFGQYNELKTLEASFNSGITYLLKDAVQFDFSFGTGLNHKMNFLSAGLSWNIIRSEE